MADPATYTKGSWTNLLPAATKAKLENIEDGIKANNDALVAETDAGRALVEAADAAAQRTALGLGDSATLDVGTGAGDVAAGNAPAGAVTTHESTYAHANIPTADEKTRLGDIQAASGATTALKLANLTSPATTTQQGVALLGANGGATKLTKMPDGATAVYVNDSAWTGWVSGSATPLSISGGVAIFTIGTPTLYSASMRYVLASPVANGMWYKCIIKRLTGSGTAFAIKTNANGTTLNQKTVQYGSDYVVITGLLQSAGTKTTSLEIAPADNGAVGDQFALAGFALYSATPSYLPGSLSEEAARIANELGDTAGVAAAATATITAADVATAGKGDTIGGKKYTFVAALSASPGVEGEVLKEATKEAELENENLAISEVSRANNGVKYWAAAVNPLVSSSRTNAILTLTARNAGILGNHITVVCESGTNHTASGATFSGGKNAVGDKIKTQLNAAIGAGAAVGAIPTKTSTSIIGYFAVADCASGAQVTLPAGGTWAWEVTTYGATYNSVKSGTAAGGAAITGTASANLCMRYERVA